MSTLLCEPGYTPPPGLNPIDQSFVPFSVGEKIAFKEDHEEHAGMYGVLKAIGVNEQGLAFDVDVIDPAVGSVVEGQMPVRVTMSEIQ